MGVSGVTLTLTLTLTIGVGVRWAFAGDNVDVGFAGAELNAIAQGFVLPLTPNLNP